MSTQAGVRARDGSTVAARACLALAVLALVVRQNLPLHGEVFIGGRPVLWWLAAAFALIAAFGLYVRASMAGHSAWAQAPTRLSRARLVVVRLATVVVVCLAAVWCAFAALLDGDATYVTLRGGDDESCRIVVRERAFFTTSGDLFEVRDGVVVAEPVARYTLDDGARPLDDGAYRVAWSGDTVSLWLTDGDGPTGATVARCGGG